MKTVSTLIAGAALAAALAGGVLAQTHGHDSAAPHAMPSTNDSASTRELKQVNLKMMKDMEQSYTGVPDVDFVRGMIPHHQGAIDMAKVQLKYGKDPEIRKLAEKIIADQEREIAEMQAWLKKNEK